MLERVQRENRGGKTIADSIPILYQGEVLGEDSLFSMFPTQTVISI
jgi:hypothetical protein